MPLGSGGAGGLGAIGMFIMPISIAVMLLKQPPGPVSKLIKAGAVDPETARRAERLEIPRPFVLEPFLARGIVHRTSDGRYWVDVTRNRRYRRRLAVVAGLVMLAVLVSGWLLWPVLVPPPKEI